MAEAFVRTIKRDDARTYSLPDARSVIAQLSVNDEWQLQHRYMQIEGMAGLAPVLIEKTIALPPHAA